MFLAWQYPLPEPASFDTDPEYSFMIDVIDIFGLLTSTTITHPPNELAAVALACHGYLSNSPVNLSLAISFKALELFCSIKLVKASFSAEAFAKLIPYCPMYRKALADALDIYLTICCSPLTRVIVQLGA
ncbi:hypothetical protein NUW54_g4090 [Trametes sanguinea]|uniref:Uncharacterized protein n=1 Tax=Trametes sanguinea TaxID=158606 RepID=A0ACC1Q0T8_9APHY|nr:hypothetical protein NUW54_g4090 [Trametes sanguinea]